MHKIQLLKWTLDIIFDTLQWLIVVNVFYMSMWKKLFYNSLIFDFNLLMELSQRVAGPQFTKRKLEIQVSCLQSTTESLRNKISKSKSCYIGRYEEWLVSTKQRSGLFQPSFTGQRSPCLMLISREWQSHLLYHLF